MSEKVRVTKIFSFDMAHALDGYDGMCKNIHGHTYHLYVTLIGDIIDLPNHPKKGMVVDFGDVKKIITDQIITIFDHALVIHKNADYAIKEHWENYFEKLIKVPFQPTCENMVIHFKKCLFDQFPSNIKLISLKLYETPTSYAEWLHSDNYPQV